MGIDAVSLLEELARLGGLVAIEGRDSAQVEAGDFVLGGALFCGKLAAGGPGVDACDLSDGAASPASIEGDDDFLIGAAEGGEIVVVHGLLKLAFFLQGVAEIVEGEGIFRVQ